MTGVTSWLLQFDEKNNNSVIPIAKFPILKKDRRQKEANCLRNANFILVTLPN